MNSSAHQIDLHTSARTFLHASIAFVVGISALLLAAASTGSMDILTQYALALLRQVQPQLDAFYLPNSILLGLLLDTLVGVTVSLLVFNRLHFHAWFPKRSAEE